MNSHENIQKQIHTGTVRSIKRKKFKQQTNLYDELVFVRKLDGADGNITHSTSDNKKSYDVENNFNLFSVFLNNKNQNRMTMLWNTTGWIRVHCGPDRTDLSCDDPSRMVHVVSSATTKDIVNEMDLPEEYTLWVCLLNAYQLN